MRFARWMATTLWWSIPVLVPLPVSGQGALEDYRRAAGVNERLAGLTVDVAQPPTWIEARTRTSSITTGINFDGKGLVAYTEADGNHTLYWSPDRQYFVDMYSRVDVPTIMELRRVGDMRMIPLEKGDMSAQLATGWRPPGIPGGTRGGAQLLRRAGRPALCVVVGDDVRFLVTGSSRGR